MIVMCERDGLTQGNQVYRRGQLFKLSEHLLPEVKKLTDAELERRQKRVYKCRIYRRPTSEEIIEAFKKKQLIIEDLDDIEKAVVLKYLKSDHLRKAEAVDALLDKANLDDIKIEGENKEEFEYDKEL